MTVGSRVLEDWKKIKLVLSEQTRHDPAFSYHLIPTVTCFRLTVGELEGFTWNEHASSCAYASTCAYASYATMKRIEENEH